MSDTPSRGREDGDPVPAAPAPRAGVRLGRFLRHHTAYVITTIIAIAGLTTGAVSLGISASHENKNTHVAQQNEANERLGAAISELGSSASAVRFDGVQELQRVMVDRPEKQPIVIQTLCQFIRANTPGPVAQIGSPPPDAGAVSPPTKHPGPAPDIQAALDVIGHRDPGHDGATSIDLSYTDLANATLNGANLGHANLSFARLVHVSLNNANLADTSLVETSLEQASMIGADLDGADLAIANLDNANLTHASLNHTELGQSASARAIFRSADLSGASVIAATFSGAQLDGAKLNGADLTGTTMNETMLCRNHQAIYPDRHYRCD